ncbi:MAG: hypothetical protein H6R13_2492 [Proteobacteria bacterium]|nr:hypothetical protein [Pseudomonadota bacterium]
MSLLMDALKRAETTKQEAARAQFGIQPAEVVDSLSLEPIARDPANGSSNPLPDLAIYQDALDADLASTPLSAARPPPQAKAAAPVAATEVRDREAVRNAFTAKKTPEPKSRLALWLALGTLGLAGVTIGGYVWYQLNAMSHGSLATPPRASALQPGNASPALMPPAAPIGLPTPPEQPGIENTPQSTGTPLFAPRTAPPPSRMPAAHDGQSSGAPIRLIRTQPEPDANLTRGHSSLQRGETELARQDFEQALQRDPNNTDALLVLAAIAHRQGRPAEAENFRQRALVANPSDPAAQAAALNGPSAASDPQTAESRLKTLLSAQPDSAPLNFALGNLYSRQSRWPEAQQVYFNAVTADSDNPDYLFNLAVSLDHLRQNRLAAQHYRLAIEAANKRPAAFDRNKVEKRLGELQAEPAR